MQDLKLSRQNPDQSINPINGESLRRLKVSAGEGPVLILTHDNPDPDGLSSGKALATLLMNWEIRSDLIYSGIVARAENKEMLRSLTPEWQPDTKVQEFCTYSSIALVDSQPGAGNNSLPADIKPNIVIDHHHPIQSGMAHIEYIDMRPDVGATASLLYQHLEAAGIVPDNNLSTALFYGIQTDTQGLSRGTSWLDKDIYIKLLSLIDRQKLIQVERAGLSRDYFRAFNKGLQAARIFNQVVIVDLDKMHRPDFVAEIADLMIRLNDAQASLCTGYHEDTLYFSLRSKPDGYNAESIVQEIIFSPGKAGGHGTMAGGQFDLINLSYKNIAGELIKRFLSCMNETGKGDKLLDT